MEKFPQVGPFAVFDHFIYIAMDGFVPRYARLSASEDLNPSSEAALRTGMVTGLHEDEASGAGT